MINSEATTKAKNAEELFKLVMNLYWTYLNALETLSKRIPETETAVLSELVGHMKEVQKALEHDISVFRKAIDSDSEDLQTIQDQLKIDVIQKKLKEQ
jgi:hypothetical protein